MIKNGQEFNLYKVTKLDDDSKIFVAARGYSDLDKDLIETGIEPSKIELLNDVYITTGILGN